MQPHPIDVERIARQVAQRLTAAGRGSLPKAPAQRPLVTADCLRGIPAGGRFELDEEAVVTPLARDRAWRLGIRFVSRVAARGAAERASLRIALGADHGGLALKREAAAWLRELGHRPLDLGAHGEGPHDYPDVARRVALAVARGDADRGLCIDGAGIGSAMVANKVRGVLAAHCRDEAEARNAREHNHANVLTLAGGLPRGVAHDVLRVFLATPVGEGRHRRRVDQIRAQERGSASA